MAGELLQSGCLDAEVRSHRFVFRQTEHGRVLVAVFENEDDAQFFIDCDQVKAQRDKLLDLVDWFCQRVEAGEVRSRLTYERFKSAIAEIKAGQP